MSNTIKNLVHDVVASPLGDIIASVGEGVAEAQQALDEGSLAKTLEIYSEGNEETLRVLREIGYRPTFYALPETTGEVRVSLQLGQSAQGSTSPLSSGSSTAQPIINTQLSRLGRNISAKPRLYATPVDAGYANRYGYQANVSAKLTFKIVPVPAPDGVDDLRLLPNFINKSIAESQALAESLGLELSIQNSAGNLLENADINAKVTEQMPTPDSQPFARLGEEIILTIV